MTGGAALSTGATTLTTVAGSGIDVDILGTGTTWTASSINLGGAGLATMTVDDGAEVRANGDFIVDGAATTSLTITGGGRVEMDNDRGAADRPVWRWARPAPPPAASASARPSSTSSATPGPGGVSGDIRIGASSGASGDLTIQDGGMLNTDGTAVVGANAGTGEVTVTGTGSTWSVSGLLDSAPRALATGN